jgi:hypothetical protein
VTRCALHPHDAEELLGATHRSATGVKCRWPRGQARDRIAVCQRTHVSTPPRQRGGRSTRARVLSALTARAQTTAAVAARARLPQDTAYGALWHAQVAGLAVRTGRARPGATVTWRLP